MDTTRLQDLFTKYYNKTATADEKAELMLLIKQASPKELASMILEEGQGLEVTDFSIAAGKAAEILDAILAPQAPVVELAGREETILHTAPQQTSSRRLRWTRYAAAASVILFLGFGTYYLLLKKSPRQAPVAQMAPTQNDVKAPAQNRAIITLANGKVIYLDSVKNGTIALEEGAEVVKLADGQIVYNHSGAAAANAPMAFNTISNPVGSNVIDMVLTDGSRVWLNAASSLTYPVAFAGGERNVSITGEAYFEVAENKARPFKVQFNETVVEVLGTHFNINAYADEPFSKTTLLQGAVRISKGNQQKILSPGNQAVTGAQNIQVLIQADTEEAIAWKNNYFQFSSADIETIMRQTARWYNIEVSYQGAVPTDRFSGKISRAVNLTQFLKVLQYSEVNFKLEGRKLTVLP
jgi:ferric-dicitrate binding protein FerR (iron transport regulator)